MYKRNGFTLAELLIVVAIIAVLVAIAIPVFTSQLEKSREATDAANIRSLYGEVMVEANTTGADINIDGSLRVTLKQKEADWQNAGIKENLYSIANKVDGAPSPDGSAWVSYDPNSADAVVIHFEGGTGGETGGGAAGGETGGGNLGNTISAGTSYAPQTPKMLNGNSVTITSPVDVEIEIEVHAGGGNSIVKESKKITLKANEPKDVQFNKNYNNSKLTIKFGTEVSKEFAESLYNSIQQSQG